MPPPRTVLKNMRQTRTNGANNIPTLKAKTWRAIQNWKNGQTRRVSNNKEANLKKAATNAMHIYTAAVVKHEDEKYNRNEKSRIGTARNMSGFYLPTNRINYSGANKRQSNYNKNRYTRHLKRSRENWIESNKGLSGIGINENFKN